MLVTLFSRASSLPHALAFFLCHPSTLCNHHIRSHRWPSYQGKSGRLSTCENLSHGGQQIARRTQRPKDSVGKLSICRLACPAGFLYPFFRTRRSSLLKSALSRLDRKSMVAALLFNSPNGFFSILTFPSNPDSTQTPIN